NDENVNEILKDVNNILIPSGIEFKKKKEKISAIKYARENNVPYFGICLGMQLATVEFARNVLGFENAHSAELDPSTPHPIIDLLPEQKDIEDLGGTLRLGLYPCHIKE
ncbi:CTP synthase, partial [bacterium M00.F.Ca.ET.162.01.1.1]